MGEAKHLWNNIGFKECVTDGEKRTLMINFAMKNCPSNPKDFLVKIMSGDIKVVNCVPQVGKSVPQAPSTSKAQPSRAIPKQDLKKVRDELWAHVHRISRDDAKSVWNNIGFQEDFRDRERGKIVDFFMKNYPNSPKESMIMILSGQDPQSSTGGLEPVDEFAGVNDDDYGMDQEEDLGQAGANTDLHDVDVGDFGTYDFGTSHYIENETDIPDLDVSLIGILICLLLFNKVFAFTESKPTREIS